MTPHVCSVARRSGLRVVILRRARHWVDFGLTANPTTYLEVRKIAMRQQAQIAAGTWRSLASGGG